MLRSMTGFGRGEAVQGGCSAVVEIRSVNHRYFDFSFRTARAYLFLEDKIKECLKEGISRGKVEVSLVIERAEESGQTVRVDEALAGGYVDAVEKLADTFGLKNDLSAAALSRYPDVLVLEKAPEDEEALWLLVKEATDAALSDFIASREREGERLKKDFLDRLSIIETIVGEIEVRSPELVSGYRARIEARIRELLEAVPVDEARLLTETAIFADKINVTEEIVRLKSHFAEIRKLFSGSEAVGRKLDFIIQELNREINTIGSKSNDYEIARRVVDVKAEIEKMREQIQNIE